MTTIEQDTVAANSIGPTVGPSAADSDVHIERAATLATEIRCTDSDRVDPSQKCSIVIDHYCEDCYVLPCAANCAGDTIGRHRV